MAEENSKEFLSFYLFKFEVSGKPPSPLVKKPLFLIKLPKIGSNVWGGKYYSGRMMNVIELYLPNLFYHDGRNFSFIVKIWIQHAYQEYFTNIYKGISHRIIDSFPRILKWKIKDWNQFCYKRRSEWPGYLWYDFYFDIC